MENFTEMITITAVKNNDKETSHLMGYQQTTSTATFDYKMFITFILF